MPKKYVLIPNYVFSNNDSDRHWIDAQTLARLYGVSLRDCHIVDTRGNLHGLDIGGEHIILEPKRSGDYSLPKEEYVRGLHVST